MNSIARVDSLTKGAMYSNKIGFVTVLIEEIEPNEAYEVYSVTEKRGKEFINSTCSRDESFLIAADEEQRISRRIEKKRNEKPTANQLMTLFDMKIPIPVTLTFGQASDLINSKIEASREKKRQKMLLCRV